MLFKGGQSIEQLANTGAVAFDKTGTLTFGRPRLYEVHPVAWSDGIEAFLADAQLHVLDGVGHFVPLQAPDEVARAIRAATGTSA